MGAEGGRIHELLEKETRSHTAQLPSARLAAGTCHTRLASRTPLGVPLPVLAVARGLAEVRFFLQSQISVPGWVFCPSHCLLSSVPPLGEALGVRRQNLRNKRRTDSWWECGGAAALKPLPPLLSSQRLPDPDTLGNHSSGSGGPVPARA